MQKKLNLVAPINRTSYGYHSSYTYHYLSQMGYDVGHINIGQNDPDPRFKFDFAQFHKDADCLKIWHQFDLSGYTGKKRNIAFTVFELDELSGREIHHMGYPDLLIVATEWAKGVCENHGLKATVVPLGYDDEIFAPTPFEQRENTIFANFGKWELRKGHDVLIKAFNAAFDKEDKVTLIMMPSNPFLNRQQVSTWEKIYLESKLGDKIQIIPRLPNHSDVYNVMRQVDCGVFPARAEGWNLEALEMLGCGKHLIITNCTGHTGYVNSSNSRLIEMDESKLEPAYDNVFFNGTYNWRAFGKDQFDCLVNHMREVHQNRPNLEINSPGVADAKKLSWKNSINVLAETIS